MLLHRRSRALLLTFSNVQETDQQSLSRQDAKSAKDNIFFYFSELGVLCVFARLIFFPIPYSKIQPKTSNILG